MSTSIVLRGGGGRCDGISGIGGSVCAAPGRRGGFLRDDGGGGSGGALGALCALVSSGSSQDICTSIVGRNGGLFDVLVLASSESGSGSSHPSCTSIV